jgi:putative oxidoreductase
MKDLLALAARGVLGGYLAVHGAQKLFGVFGGAGLDKTGAGFEHLGLTPGTPMAAFAGGSELVGGTLIAIGALHPLGPIAVSGTMIVATVVHAPNGPLSQKGGYELALTNLGFAALVAAVGPGRHAVGGHLPSNATAVVGGIAAGLTGVAIVKVVRRRRQRSSAGATTSAAAAG